MVNLKEFENALAHLAFPSQKTKGRLGLRETENYFYDDDSIFEKRLDPFEIDSIKIINCKAFRRLANKTQVFPLPNNPHIRNRQQHTLEVLAIALPLAKFLGLNSALCQAIAYGHDIGHAPFGHFGEKYISEFSGKPFNHAVNGVVIAQYIERKGAGLNLCSETLQGILQHSRTNDPDLKIKKQTIQEISLVMLADKIAYAFADYNDAKRVGYIKEPNSSNIEAFGAYQRSRVATCFQAIVKESAQKGQISFNASMEAKEFKILRQWLYEKIYKPINFDVQKSYLDRLVEFLTTEKYFVGYDPFLLLSLLTDKEVFQFGEFCNTARIPAVESLSNFGVIEIVPWLKDKNIDFSKHGLNL